MHAHGTLLPLVALLSLAGCGSGSSSPAETCPATFTACGGDLVGTWTYARMCGTDVASMSAITTQCAAATTTTSDATTGSYTFTAAGTYSATLTLDYAETVTLPPSCLGGATSCDMIPQGTMSDSGLTTTTTCTFSATQGCTCQATVTSTTVTETGTYTSAGNAFTPMDSEAQGYCVNGSELLVSDSSGDSSQLFTVFTKQ